MKKFFYSLIISVLLISCTSKQQELVFLSVNDMHGHFEVLPKLAYIADSLRNIYPQLMIVSAGDNRTGNAYNDKYPEYPNLPMIHLMSEIGFEVSALGNHDFDGNIEGVQYFMDNASFPMVCANADFSAYPDIKMPAYVTITKNIDGRDIKIVILGLIETSNDGRPSAHVKNLKDMKFVPAKDVIKDYLYLRDSCDVFVLLSHCGKEQDLEFAAEYSQFDLVIGGHSHDLCTELLDNGVLYTQSKYYLKNATVTKIKIIDGKIVDKEAYVFDLKKFKGVNKQIQKEVDKYFAEPEFQTVVGHAKNPFNDKKALGAYMADAQRYITKADIAMQNPGGVRFDNLHGGDLTKADVYDLDPFNNSLVITEMTGKQVEDFLVTASINDHDCTHVSGITYTIDYVLSEEGSGLFTSAKAFINGKRLDSEKVYKVTVNSYMAPWIKNNCISMHDSGLTSNEAEFLYLKNHESIDYKDVSRYELRIIEE